jgi:hypothetical protein
MTELDGPITMFSTTTLTEQKYLKIAKQKDNLLFHILLLMKHDSEENYIIDKENKGVVDEATALYVPQSTDDATSDDLKLEFNANQIEQDWMEQKDQCTAAWNSLPTEKELLEERLRYGNPEVIFDDSAP